MSQEIHWEFYKDLEIDGYIHRMGGKYLKYSIYRVGNGLYEYYWSVSNSIHDELLGTHYDLDVCKERCEEDWTNR